MKDSQRKAMFAKKNKQKIFDFGTYSRDSFDNCPICNSRKTWDNGHIRYCHNCGHGKDIALEYKHVKVPRPDPNL